jgi:hypothetical protein
LRRVAWSDGFGGTDKYGGMMPLFRCEECGSVENTACCSYWLRKNDGELLLCSECDPDIGEWHGKFEKRPADRMLIDQNGHLWSCESVAAGQLPAAYRIVGEVTPEAQTRADELLESAFELMIEMEERDVTPNALANAPASTGD